MRSSRYVVRQENIVDIQSSYLPDYFQRRKDPVKSLSRCLLPQNADILFVYAIQINIPSRNSSI